MPNRAPARRPAALAAGVAAGALLLGGCGDQPAERSDAAASRTTSSAPSSPSSTAPTSPSTGPSSPSTTKSASPALTSPGPLLSAAELPGFNADYRWRPGATTPHEPATSFGTCQRFGLLAIGAERVVVRRYRPPADASASHDRAGELVATFPDAATARRAYAVLGLLAGPVRRPAPAVPHQRRRRGP